MSYPDPHEIISSEIDRYCALAQVYKGRAQGEDDQIARDTYEAVAESYTVLAKTMERLLALRHVACLPAS